MLRTPMILSTRLQPPRYKPDALRRERLLALVRDRLDRKLLTITAGPGYGKTTLLVELLHDAKLPAVWYSLDQSDSDPAAFFSYLAAGVGQCCANENTMRRGSQGRTAKLLRQAADMADSHEQLAGSLINELSDRRREELFLVLDDYHSVADDSQVHRLVDYFIGHMPQNIHVVIASRTTPPLPGLAALRAKQELFELQQPDLAFTLPEVRDLLERQYRPGLPEQEIVRLLERTGGWITGIHLVLQSAGPDRTVKETLNGFLASTRPLFDYFASEILGRETAESQRQLAAAAHLERMDPKACDAILTRKGSDSLLEQWEHKNLFISRAGDGSFSFHPLFRQFLRDQLQDDALRQELHRRAGNHYRARGDTNQAIEYFIKAGEHGPAAELISGNTEDLLFLGSIGSLRRWLDLLPPEHCDRHPHLLLARARLLRERGDHQQEIETLQRATGLFRAADDRQRQAMALKDLGDAHYVGRDLAAATRIFQQAARTCPKADHRLQSHILNSLGLVTRDQGRIQSSYRYFMQARRALTRGPSTLSDRTSLDNNIALLLLRKGELLKGLAYYRRLMEFWSKEYFLEVGVLIANAVRVAVETGHLDLADHWLAAGRKICEPHPDNLSRAALDECGGYLRMYHGRWDEAAELLERARQGYLSMQYEQRALIQWRLRARAARLANDTASARQYLDQYRSGAAAALGDLRNIQGVNFLFDLSLLQTAEGLPGDALANAGIITSTARILRWPLGEFMGRLAAAAAHHASQNRRAAGREWSRTAALCIRYGYHGLLGGEGRFNHDVAGIVTAGRGQSTALRSLFGVHASGRESRRTVIPVRLFGTIALTDSRGRIRPVRFRTRKIASLFAYLLLHRDRSCPSQELVRAVWGDDAAEMTDRKLYPAVSYLKKDLGRALPAGFGPDAPPIVSDERGYRLASRIDWQVDAEQYAAFCASMDAMARSGSRQEISDLYRQARELRCGQFLSGIDDPWVDEYRARWREPLRTLLAKLVDQLTGDGDIEQALHYCDEHLQDDPLAEPVRIRYWSLLHKTGRLSDVHRDYQVYLQLLRRDYGVRPSEELRAAYRSVV